MPMKKSFCFGQRGVAGHGVENTGRAVHPARAAIYAMNSEDSPAGHCGGFFYAVPETFNSPRGFRPC
jgi:hypothetical protein